MPPGRMDRRGTPRSRLELGRRRNAPWSFERVIAALVGGLVGWGMNVMFNLDLIRLVVPVIPPRDVLDAVFAAVLIGAIAGAITALTGTAIFAARGWSASPARRLVVGGLAMVAGAVVVTAIASPAAAVGPGGRAIVWAETTETAAFSLLAIAVLRAAMTTAAVVAGGCGGVFVPFLAIGDIAGRVFAGPFGVPADLAGAAGAAAGIAGGYRLPSHAARRIPPDDDTIAILELQRDRVKRRAEVCELAFNDDGYVFTATAAEMFAGELSFTPTKLASHPTLIVSSLLRGLVALVAAQMVVSSGRRSLCNCNVWTC